MKKTAGIALCAAVGVLNAGGSLLSARAAEELQQPTFRTATQIIEIDVRVTSRDGRFISGLSQDDFDVLEDGEPQQITQFSFVNLSSSGKQVEQFAASAKADGDRAIADRTYAMLLDGPAASRDHVQRMRNVARLFLDTFFGPADEMAVTFVKYFDQREQETVEQPFTRDRRAIEAAVDRLAPHTRVSTGVEGVIRAYETIEQVSNRLGAIGGGRKVLVWIGGQVPFDPNDGPYKRRAAAIASAYHDAMRAANRHNVAIYPIDLLGLTTRLSNSQGWDAGRGGAELKRMAALRVVAEDTGGEAIVGTNNYEQVFAQIASRTSAYYLLGYQTSGIRCDGRFHAVTVRVKRAGAVVRARRGYFAPEPRNTSTLSATEHVNSAASGACQ